MWDWDCLSAQHFNESGVLTRGVGSNDGVRCILTQLFSRIGRCLAMNLWTLKSGHLDVGFSNVVIPSVSTRRSSSAVVPCVCSFETLWQINDGVWQYQEAMLWPATICDTWLVKVVLPQCKCVSRKESSDNDLFVNADHLGHQLTYWSHTGVIHFVNRAPIILSLLTATHCGIIRIWLGVHCFEDCNCNDWESVVQVEDDGCSNGGLSNAFCKNEAVTKNSVRPESILKKKHLTIAYHCTHEVQAAGTLRIIKKEDGETNLANTSS